MRHLIPYFRKYKLETFLAPLFKMLEASFDLIIPLIVAKIINNGILNSDRSIVIKDFFIMLAMGIFGFISCVAAQYFAARAATGTATGLRRELIKKIQSFSFTELDEIGNSTLITRITSDVNQVQNGINMFLRLFLRSPFIVFGAVILSFTINKKISLVFLGVVVILFIIVFGIMFITSPMYKNVQENLDSVTLNTRESLNGVRVIRAFAREQTQNRLFMKINELLYDAQIKAGKVATLINPLTYAVINSGIILILYLGSLKVNSGELSSGNIIALINYISQILIELVKLANLVILLGKSVSCMQRIGQIIDTEPTMSYGTSTPDSEFENIIRFDSVSLTYKGAGSKSLENISFSVKRGETIGVIGGTGSGKTSLVNLIPRFYDATEGRVYIKDLPINDFSREELLKTVSIADQRPKLFSGTIRSNLKWGNQDASDEEIWRALEVAQALDFVKNDPSGLDKTILQGGSNLSGGQKQRLTIARAILSKGDILILDDCASALDYATDAALRKSISELSGDMTVIIVSQRAGSLLNADKTIVLDDGKIVGIGKHDDLYRNCDVYKEIYDSQFKSEAK